MTKMTPNPEGLQWFKDTYFPLKEKKVSKPALVVEISDPDYEEKKVRSALFWLNPASKPYEEWLGIGMALKDGGYSCALWDQWSMADSRYEPGMCQEKWDSFSGTSSSGRKLTIATIINMAKSEGWKAPPRPQATSRKDREPVPVTKEQVEQKRFDDDKSNADYHAQRIEGKLKHVPEVSKLGWLRFNQKYWEQDSSEYVEQAKKTAESLMLRVSEMPEGMQQDYYKWARKSCMAERINAMVSLSKTDPRIKDTIKEFDVDPYQLVCSNGVLDLRSLNLQRHSPSFKVMRCAVDYKPDADQSLWLWFLGQAMKEDSELIQFVKRSIGYAVTGLMHEERFWFLYGPPRTGKGTFTTVIKEALGNYAAYSNASAWMKQHNSDQLNSHSQFDGYRFIWIGEMSNKDRVDEPKLKGWIGGDPTKARKLFVEPYEFLPVGKLWFQGNYLPKVTADDAIFGKMFVIPFRNREIVVNKKVKQVLRDEHKEAALAWAIEGAHEYLEYGLGDIPRSVLSATAEYRKEADHLEQFLEDCCEREQSCAVGSTKLYECFLGYLESQKLELWTQTQFGLAMSEKGFERKKKDNLMHYKGIKLNGT